MADVNLALFDILTCLKIDVDQTVTKVFYLKINNNSAFPFHKIKQNKMKMPQLNLIKSVTMIQGQLKWMREQTI